jgi:putative hydrolase of the HAD superfamily
VFVLGVFQNKSAAASKIVLQKRQALIAPRAVDMPMSKTVLSLLHPIETHPAQIKQKLRKIPGLRAVIFDVYGTLFATTGGLRSLIDPGEKYDCLIIEALEDSDFDVLDREAPFSELYAEHVNAHYGIRAAEGIAYPDINICDVWQDFLNELFVQSMIDGDLTERSIRRVILCYECKSKPVWPVRGSLELIRNLQDGNVKLGTVATAQFYTPIMMEVLYQNSLETLGFKRQICTWSYEHMHRKPSPLLFDLCASGLGALGIDPADALYVGNDMLSDILPATEAGFKTALFVGNKQSARLHSNDDRCTDLSPTVIFGDFPKLLGCILP